MRSVPKHSRRRAGSESLLQIRGLQVYYGQSHALQGVDLALASGIRAVVGRNGMGKTTLCNAVMGLTPAQGGSIRHHGREIRNMPAYRIASLGIGYVPQGRRLWNSLSVEEHLKLVDLGGSWTAQRIYEIFPRLAERRRNSAAQLSGGEQQMLTISRALLQDPELLIMDEPTEGLAPVIVDQLIQLLSELAADQDVSILLIEQNISVAIELAESVDIMVNGKISSSIESAALANDRALQERLLGVGRHSHESIDTAESPAIRPVRAEPTAPAAATESAEADPAATKAAARAPIASGSAYIPPTRWSQAAWEQQKENGDLATGDAAVRPAADVIPIAAPSPLYQENYQAARAESRESAIYVAGTFDTKGEELNYIRSCIAAAGLPVKTIDLSTSGKPSACDVPPHMVAAYHSAAVAGAARQSRGASVRAMSIAFENYLRACNDVAGIISAGGSGGTSLVTPAMQALPVGTPKVMISTVASGDVSAYVGAADIMMMYSVADIQGLNRISRQVMSNGAHAIIGMVRQNRELQPNNAPDTAAKPGLALTMFGVTTTAVQNVLQLIGDQYDCYVMHATGTGGRSMEKLADSGLLAAALDLTTTEICDMMMGGVFAADEDRFGAFIRTEIPWVGSVGALDMVNFGSRDTVPERYRSRTFVEHNPNVTLMRTTADENRRMGEWIASRINLMPGPVRFLIPEAGVSALDAPGQPFHDPEADAALFDIISEQFRQTAKRRLIRLPWHINEPAFAAAAVQALNDINPQPSTRSQPAQYSYGTI